MSKHVACPHCGQRMTSMRAGARLPPLKARIYDAIARAGADGISGPEIIESLGLDVGKNGIRAHVWQINEILERFNSTVRIVRQEMSWRVIDRRKIALAKEKRI